MKKSKKSLYINSQIIKLLNIIKMKQYQKIDKIIEVLYKFSLENNSFYSINQIENETMLDLREENELIEKLANENIVKKYLRMYKISSKGKDLYENNISYKSIIKNEFEKPNNESVKIKADAGANVVYKSHQVSITNNNDLHKEIGAQTKLSHKFSILISKRR